MIVILLGDRMADRDACSTANERASLEVIAGEI
jgi:hypothetical protein